MLLAQQQLMAAGQSIDPPTREMKGMIPANATEKLLIAERMGKADEEAQPEARPKQRGVSDSSDKLPGAIDMEDYDWSESELKLSMYDVEPNLLELPNIRCFATPIDQGIFLLGSYE
ncbi:hypothetical protein B0H14DRAFT_3507596 [Mycena olivaceomarginata]|nr:hypothetical protein B0H14DRAFT_3507596 [Mycena olivaceomarginata]